MKNIIVFIILFSNVFVFSQQVEIVGGINQNMFYDRESFTSLDADYTNETGYALKIAFENAKINKFKWRVEIGYEKYGGKINVFNAGRNGANRVEAEIDKSILSLTFYPLNATLWNRLDINLGVEISNLIGGNYIGTHTNYSSLSSMTVVTDLKKRYTSYNTKFNFGLRGRIAYNFNISEKLILAPQISYFYGHIAEFKEFPKHTRSIRPFFGIGIGWDI